ncbi:hypothetical protein MMC10_003669 [Thelotrema lepadinum]|nr:hypothetical protein [Thelotrema lepadinum]
MFQSLRTLNILAPYIVLNRLLGRNNFNEPSKNLKPIYQLLSLSLSSGALEIHQRHFRSLRATSPPPSPPPHWNIILLNDGTGKSGPPPTNLGGTDLSLLTNLTPTPATDITTKREAAGPLHHPSRRRIT